MKNINLEIKKEKEKKETKPENNKNKKKNKSKVGKLKLNGDFLKKLESSIGCKAVSSSSSNHSSSTVKKKPNNNLISNNDTTPFIPPLPPNLIKRKKIEKDEIPKQEEQSNRITEQTSTLTPHSIVINNNIHNTQPNKEQDNLNNSNFLNQNFNLILELLKEKYKSLSPRSDKHNEPNQQNKIKKKSFLNKQIKFKTIFYYLLTFTSGYFIGRLY
jgi:hypothetical protein